MDQAFISGGGASGYDFFQIEEDDGKIDWTDVEMRYHPNPVAVSCMHDMYIHRMNMAGSRASAGKLFP